jgi:hypothetical protein
LRSGGLKPALRSEATVLPNGLKAGETIRLRRASFLEVRSGLLSRIADYS